MEELLRPPSCDQESLGWLPFVVKRADGKTDLGSWEITANLLLWPQEFLEPVL